MIPSRTDNESEVDQHRMVVFRFPDQGHSYLAHPYRYQMNNISHYLTVVEFLYALLIKACKDQKPGSGFSIPPQS